MQHFHFQCGQTLVCKVRWISYYISMCLCLQVTMYVYNWSVDLGGSLNQGLVRLVHWQNARAHVVNCLLSQKMGLFHHYCFSDTPTHDDLKQVSIQTLWLCSQCNTSMLTIHYKQYMKQTFQTVIWYVVVISLCMFISASDIQLSNLGNKHCYFMFLIIFLKKTKRH